MEAKHISSVVANILEGKSHPFFTGFFDDREPILSGAKAPSRTSSKRFKLFGITTHEQFQTTTIITPRNLQSPSLGRSNTTSFTDHSASAQPTFSNHQALPALAISTLNFTSIQDEALVTVALGDHGG